MTPKAEFRLVALPRWEMVLYWVLSIGSHLYSFYELHRFSKAHEASLDREVQLERGFLTWGFKKDPTDFEWSFWNEWAWHFLLWSLIGHGVVSRLVNIYLPQFRVAILTVYGFLAALGLLGLRGVAVLLLHLSISLAVAQLHRAALSWGCTLLLLSTLHISSIQDIQSSWYKFEEEYFLLLFSVAVCGLRCLSFSLELCRLHVPLEPAGPPGSSPPRPGAGRLLLAHFCSLAAYCFYHPLFHNGPILTYSDFSRQIKTAGCQMTALRVLGSILRVCMWWCCAEAMIHLMYMHAIQGNETYLEILSPWALGGLALALVQFFYLKYLVLFGVPSLLVQLDGLEPPGLPRCVSITYSFTGMWRHFDVGLYRWLIRYIYVPLGGSRNGVLRKVISTALAFGFVCFWHGCHDYMQRWALLNWVGVLLESTVSALLSSPLLQPAIVRWLSPPMQRRGLALASAFSTAMLILSNLVFLGGNHVGRIFWKRVFVQGWSNIAVPMLGFLYCFAQVGLEWDRKADVT